MRKPKEFERLDGQSVTPISGTAQNFCHFIPTISLHWK